MKNNKMPNQNQPKSYEGNTILDNWDPLTWGFTVERTRSTESIIDSYYKLDLTDILSIHISCRQYPTHPNDIVEQAVEVSICDHFELLAHIDSTTKMALLIRSMSGKSYKSFTNLQNDSDDSNT